MSLINCSCIFGANVAGGHEALSNEWVSGSSRDAGGGGGKAGAGSSLGQANRMSFNQLNGKNA